MYREFNTRRPALSALLLLVALSWWSCGVSAPAQDATDDLADPLGVLALKTDNRLVYGRFLSNGIQQVEEQSSEDFSGLTVEAIRQSLRQRTSRSTALPKTALPELRTAEDRYQHMIRSTLLLGTIYDCGRCDNLHANVAGGVVVSSDGLALTNYHVLDRSDDGIKAMTAMTYDGQSYPIVEVLASDRGADVALIRLGGPGPFYAAPLARQQPFPTEPVRVMSHPSNEYFVMTTGEVSRVANFSARRSRSHWMEITAPFGAGSSGSGVFNDQGEVVGLVSRIHPIFRDSNTRQPLPDDESESKATRYVEMILRRCVTLDGIMDCFQQEDDS